MEDGKAALDAVESKLASVFQSEVAHERGTEPPEPAVTTDVTKAEPITPAEGLEEFVETNVQNEGGVEPPPEEAEEAPERLRDPETGQFTTEERLYAGRYKTVDELERAVQEKQQFIDRQATELGTLRRLDNIEQRLQPAPPPAQPSLPHNFADLVDEDPATAAELAYAAGDQTALNAAVRSWDEIAPGAPRLWAQNKELSEKVDNLSNNFGQQTADQAYKEFARTHPDMDQYSGAMTEIAKQSPAVTRLLEQGDPATTTEVLDFLYTKASSQVQARNADTLASAQGAADAERDALLRQQKDTAAVASATKSAAEKKPLNEGQKMLEEIRRHYGGPDIRTGITTD
jgi:hypothetical protein